MTNNETQQTLEEYTALYQELKERTGDPSAATAILQEMARDARGAQMRAERSASRPAIRNPVAGVRHRDENAPASERQLKWLEDLGISVPRNLTRAQASALLDEAVARQKAR